MNTEEFIKKAKIIHGSTYTYDNTVYTPGKRPKVVITCAQHGDFEQRYDLHLIGKGCPSCGRDKHTKNILSRRNSSEEFIKKAKERKGTKYTYKNVTYVNARTKVLITCPEHGDWETMPSVFLNGTGCPRCGNIEGKKLLTYTNPQFIECAKKIHGEKYSYDFVEYKTNKVPILIGCKKHGLFSVIPNSHTSGKTGCPKCKNIDSKPEMEVQKFVESLGLITTSITLERKQIDIYIPELRVGIEYNGLWWHSIEKGKSENYHLDKLNLANKHGIRLLQIFDDEWLTKQDLIKNKIKYILGKSEIVKVGARKTIIKEVSAEESRLFLEQTHLQGYSTSPIRLGLYYKEVLVALATFGRSRFNSKDMELIRYSTATNTSVQGGLSKLIKEFFIENPSVEVLVSYCDRRWSTGNVYHKAGFIKVGDTKPGYFWCKSRSRFPRYKFMKHGLGKILENFDKDISEVQNCVNNGYFRVYDCGHQKWKINR